ncbi:hypothetical protein, partial [Thiobacillus thioparus]|uniref:hypothetical protein n=1 Tax=Thiobacillus thioparus TaxID=931 RepID=UPI001B7FD3B8
MERKTKSFIWGAVAGAAGIVVKNQEKFLSHCAGQVVSLRDDSSLKLSRRLMSASTEFAFIYSYLNGIGFCIRINNCDQACQQD